MCYTFNAEVPPLPTEKTGSRFGLALTLNIEQYEYMRGPQSDAGVKVRACVCVCEWVGGWVGVRACECELVPNLNMRVCVLVINTGSAG